MRERLNRIKMKYEVAVIIWLFAFFPISWVIFTAITNWKNNNPIQIAICTVLYIMFHEVKMLIYTKSEDENGPET